MIDLGWHIDTGFGAYTWSTAQYGKGSDRYPNVTQFVQQLHSGDNPLNRSLKLSLNLHPSGVVPAEQHYASYMRAIGLDPAMQNTAPVDPHNETWMQAFFDTVLDAQPDVLTDSWWTDVSESCPCPAVLHALLQS